VSGGFPKFKLKVRNTTPGRGAQGNATVQPMLGGDLRAVAKFHRNTCYKPDLSGEYGSLNSDGTSRVDWRNWQESCGRNPTEEVVVSDSIAAPSAINSGGADVVFNFPTRIPISATDLYVQVVYRGPLGEEQDAIAFATKDVSEPTYLYNYSRWDQYRYWHYPSVDPGPYTWNEWCLQGYPSIDACNEASGVTDKMRFSATSAPIPGYDPATSPVPQGTWTPLGQEAAFAPLFVSPAPVGTLARVAAIFDPAPSNAGLLVSEWVDATYGNAMFMWFTGTASATVNQLDPTTQALTPSVTYMPGRGVYLPAGEYSLLTSGTAPAIPPLAPSRSQIDCQFASDCLAE
jgi:hypothetical protein